MNELKLFDDDRMSIKEVAELLNVSDRTIRRYVKDLFPEIVDNGKKTLLTEFHITKIKIEMNKNYSLDNAVQVNTDMEMTLKLVESAKYFKDKYDLIKQENEIMKPKAISFDAFMNSKNNHSMGEVAKCFNIGRNKLYKILRENKYLMKDNLPYQYFVDGGYFTVIQKVVGNGESKHVTLVTAKGVTLIEEILK